MDRVNNTLIQGCRRLVSQHQLREIDVQLAQQILAYDKTVQEQQGLLFLVCVALSHALAKGQVCLPLANFRKTAIFSDETIRNAVAPSDSTPDACIKLLSACDTVFITNPPHNWQNQPLVLDVEFKRVYLARYYFYEQGVYQHISQRLSSTINQDALITDLQQPLRQLFPALKSADDNAQPIIDWQNIAAASACANTFAVITGGPGTGKTTTVTKLLSALLSLNPDMHIALAAPTGKAAARMTESISGAKQREQHLIHSDKIPASSFTLHRLLGWTPQGYRYHSQHPLPYDCVVVDEASMIDLPMMYHLITALSPHTRLILLGDRDQLASVEAGSVLADLCDSGTEHGPSPEFAHFMQKLTGQDIATVVEHHPGQAPRAIQNAVAQLRVSHRFDKNSGIGRLATAVNNGQYHSALNCFTTFNDIAIHWHNDHQTQDYAVPQGRAATSDLWKTIVTKGYRDYCKAVVKDDPAMILAAFSQFQVLVATRQGSLGVEDVNRHIERLLRPRLDPQQRYSGVMYPGRAIMISRNDYDLGLFNGDVGVLVEVNKENETQTTELKAAFMNTDGNIRLLLPSRLPQHETAFAITVHKSQGSEFERVFMMLPEHWKSVITRELIYTGITRAKQHFELLTSMESWEKGVLTQVQRASGLRDKLWR